MKNYLQSSRVVILFTFFLIGGLVIFGYFRFFLIFSNGGYGQRKIPLTIPQTTTRLPEIPLIQKLPQIPRIVNKVLTEYRVDLATKFQSAVDRNLSASHPDVIELVQEMMDQPSRHMKKMSLPLRHTAQSKAIVPYLTEKGMLNGGFFIECGALDGERSSNTIYLEQMYGWTGLLIEADPYFYTQLVGKNRRAWSINACLSPGIHVQWLHFKEHSHGQGQLASDGDSTRRIPCFPFESYMLALEKNTVDFFSLDIEGFELPVIKSINYTKFTVKTWTIEHPKDSDRELISVMTAPEMGYRVLAKVHDKSMFYARDVLFVKD